MSEPRAATHAIIRTLACPRAHAASEPPLYVFDRAGSCGGRVRLRLAAADDLRPAALGEPAKWVEGGTGRAGGDDHSLPGRIDRADSRAGCEAGPASAPP